MGKLLSLPLDRLLTPSHRKPFVYAPLARPRTPLLSFARSLAHGKEVYVYELNASISYSFSQLCKWKNAVT